MAAIAEQPFGAALPIITAIDFSLNGCYCRFVVVGTGNPRSWYRVSG
ncbi:hypothetical protein [Corynebacterium striatum]|nr:hypothetical protein [Corynebacterium striatum]QRP18476.1 hypothetical protein I6J27_11350 [Corynebacterium striatum]